MAKQDRIRKTDTAIGNEVVTLQFKRHELVILHDTLIDYQGILNYCLARNAHLHFPDKHTFSETQLTEKIAKSLFDRKRYLHAVEKQVEKEIYPFYCEQL